MIKSEICSMLGIEYPVFQGGMAWIADGKLAAAVSEAGGLGIIAAGNASAEAVREQIRYAREHTDKPFGVNIMLMSPHAQEVAELAAAERSRFEQSNDGKSDGEDVGAADISDDGKEENNAD